MMGAALLRFGFPLWSATSLHSALVKQVPGFISARARLRSISANLHGVDRGKGAGGEGGGDKGWTLENNAHGAIGELAPGSGGQRHEPAANSLLLMSGPKTIYTVRGGLRFPEIVVAHDLGRGWSSTSRGAQHLSGAGGNENTSEWGACSNHLLPRNARCWSCHALCTRHVSKFLCALRLCRLPCRVRTCFECGRMGMGN